MANDNQTVQLEAMAADAAGQTDETSEIKVRNTSRRNTLQAVLDLLDYTPGEKDETPKGLIQKWKEEEPEGELLDGVIGALSSLRDRIVTMRDTPNDSAKVAGAHFVGIDEEGNRHAFKFAGAPKETSAACVNYKIVLGPFHSVGGAAHTVKYGRKAADQLVFHRAGAPKDLGAREDYRILVNGS